MVLSTALRLLRVAAFTTVTAALNGCPHTASPERTVVVYGATASGVAASVAAARNGMHVVLLEPGTHVGGMTSGGLSYTDTGSAPSIGGIAREFYARVGARYGLAAAYEFEPHVAEEVLSAMLAEAGVTLRRQSPLASVEMSRNRLTSVATSDGTRHTADVFIDASYEGDLLARSNVRYAIGREPNQEYGETLNGGHTPDDLGGLIVDPYVVPGDPTSGLLPHVTAGPPTAPGAGDAHVQAYNFRLCMTSNPSNRIPIPAPATYDESEFELLGRYVDAMLSAGRTVSLGTFLVPAPLPNSKYDVNSGAAYFSTDLVGGSDDYPDAAPAVRDRIVERHTSYTRALLRYLATSSRIPSAVRADVAQYGLCADEFTDTNGWPPQLYVREGRRMIGAYVMTEADVLRKTYIPDAIGLGSYPMDSHGVTRVAVSGAARNEGTYYVQNNGPYPISYKALVPDESQASNLLVSVCVSASHVAYGSMRMEPVYMMMGHAAGTAAAIAVRQGTSVQRVEYGALAKQLRSEGQTLTWP